ncbi:MAG TPA: hypothetical protein VKT78_05490 [Fimbriimonadaceae bacterium]|nr:hypothetical protein [Fimbriimonadaceae bacterium]
MHKSVTGGAIAALSLFAAVATASDGQQWGTNDYNWLRQGSYGGSLSGLISSTNSNTSTNINLAGVYLFTNNLGVGPLIGLDAFNSSTNWSLGAVGRYYLNHTPQSTLIPFVGVTGSYSVPNQGAVKTTTYGGQIGVEYFLKPNVSLTPAFNYTRTTGSGVGFNTAGFSLGVTWWIDNWSIKY